VGVSKSVAKIASDADKPDGLTVVYPGREQAYLAGLPLATMSGIGEVAQRKLRSFGIATLGDVASADHSLLAQVFGKNAEMMRARCQGRDASPVESDDEVKSVSSEMSFAVSLSDRESISRALATMAAKVCRRLRKKQLKARTITLKLRYENLKVRTAQTRLDPPGADEFVMAQRLDALIDELWTQGMLVRLVGVAASGFGDDSSSPRQERLFELDADDGPAAPALRETLDARKRESLIDATDRIRDRFGERAVNFGRERAMLDGGTGTGAKNPEDYRKA
jgi:DNA polymerase-4